MPTLTPAEKRAILLMRSLLGHLNIECGGASDAQIVEAIGAAYELNSSIRKVSDAWIDSAGTWMLDVAPTGAARWRGDGNIGAEDSAVWAALCDGPPPILDPMMTPTPEE
jgi:hypothetical protein